MWELKGGDGSYLLVQPRGPRARNLHVCGGRGGLLLAATGHVLAKKVSSGNSTISDLLKKWREDFGVFIASICF